MNIDGLKDGLDTSAGNEERTARTIAIDTKKSEDKTQDKFVSAVPFGTC
jgi:hypothetical protein